MAACVTSCVLALTGFIIFAETMEDPTRTGWQLIAGVLMLSALVLYFPYMVRRLRGR